MNVRGLAQEAVSWYLAHVDDSAAHADNVKRFFRGPVIALTVSILKKSSLTEDVLHADQEEQAKEVTANGEIPEQAPTKNPAGSNWKEYLGKGNRKGANELPEFSEKDSEEYDTLSTRAKARLEAFLCGVSLALPSEDPSASERNVQKHSSTNGLNDKRDQLTKNNSSLSIAFDKRRELSVSGYSSANSSTHSFSLIEGLAGFRAVEKGPSSLIRSISSNRSLISIKHPQISEQDMVTRLELYLRSLHRVKTLGDCVVAAEPMRAIKARARGIVTSFIDTVSTVRQQSPVLTRLLTTLTQELLAVDILSEELSRVIRRIVSDYEHTTSFASLAFLSSPENSAEKLTPMVLQYLRYLQANWKVCEADCDLERLLRSCLNPDMRHTFKTVEFRSIGHLLEVCHDYRSELQHIEFPPEYNPGGSSSTEKNGDSAIHQAIKDLQREVITVNGNVLPPATSRAELIQLLSQTLNSRSLTAIPQRRGRRRRHRRGVKRVDSEASDVSDVNNSFLSSGSEGDLSMDDSPTRSDSVPPSRILPPRRRSFRLSTVDFLTRRLLLAGSRTGKGGDAYFVVRDLFGGEDVAVVPSRPVPGPRRETIEIIVRLASVTIRCHASFDVYPKSLVGSCEPLIQIHTTTAETISLQEIRATDSSGDDDARKEDYDSVDGRPLHMVVQELKTEKTGWRTLSVRPALYERVEVFNTPS